MQPAKQVTWESKSRQSDASGCHFPTLRIWIPKEPGLVPPNFSHFQLLIFVHTRVTQWQHYWHIGRQFFVRPDNYLLWDVVLCIVRCLAASQPLYNKCQWHPPPSCDNQKCLQTLPNIPWEGQNHPCLIIFWIFERETFGIWQSPNHFKWEALKRREGNSVA